MSSRPSSHQMTYRDGVLAKTNLVQIVGMLDRPNRQEIVRVNHRPVSFFCESKKYEKRIFINMRENIYIKYINTLV